MDLGGNHCSFAEVATVVVAVNGVEWGHQAPRSSLTGPASWYVSDDGGDARDPDRVDQ